MELDYWPLFVIFAIAWLVPMCLSALDISKVPSVIVEIVMGVIIGPYVIGVVKGDEPYLDFLSYMGFLFLIFLSGLALDIDQIIASFPRKKLSGKKLLNNSFFIACFIYIGAVLLAFPVAELINLRYDMDRIFLIILLPSVALSIIVPVIKNDGELSNKFGQIILQVGAIATIMTIVLISIYTGLINHGFEFELLLFLLIFVLFFASFKVGKVMMKVKTFRKILYQLDHAASQIRIRGSIAVLFLFVAVAAAINTEPVLGAFCAGTLLSIFLSKKRSSLLFKLDGMSYGFFIPIFFIMVGVGLDLSNFNDIGDSVVFILIILLAFYAVQLLPTLFMNQLFGLRKSLSAGILLTSRMGLTIASAQIGLSLGLIDSSANTAIVVATILASMISPFLYNMINREINHHYSIYIVGGGIIGSHLADRLKLHGVSHLVIDNNKEKCDELLHSGIEVKLADGTQSELYKELQLRPQDTIVLLTESDERNAAIASMLKTNLGHSNVLTTTFDLPFFKNKDELEDIQLIGVQEVIAAQIENEILRPTTVHALTDNFGNYSVEEIHVTRKDVNRKTVKDIPFPPSGSLIVLRRDREVFIPHGDTHLLIGDTITVIGDLRALEEFRRILE